MIVISGNLDLGLGLDSCKCPSVLAAYENWEGRDKIPYEPGPNVYINILF